MDPNDKLRIIQELIRITEKQIQIAREQLKLSQELEKDTSNQELLNQIRTLAQEKSELYAKSKELEKKLLE